MKSVRSPSIAAGMLVVCGVLAVAVLVRVGRLVADGLVAAGVLPPPTLEPVCRKPVQVRRGLGVKTPADGGSGAPWFLDCASSPVHEHLAGCGSLTAGDRVVLDEAGGCHVEAQGMDAATRLLVGLRLDVNRVDVGALTLLRGVGPKTAGAIVAYRDAHGPFVSLADLLKVKGVGPKTLAKLSAWLAVETAAGAQTPSPSPSQSQLESQSQPELMGKVEK